MLVLWRSNNRCAGEEFRVHYVINIHLPLRASEHQTFLERAMQDLGVWEITNVAKSADTTSINNQCVCVC